MTPEIAVARFPLGYVRSIESLGKGRIHATFHVHAESGEYVLQKIAKIFAPMMEDIERVTAHLALKGIVTTRLVRTQEETLGVDDGDSSWRLMTFIPGETIETHPSVARAESAARFVAHFQAALLDYEKPFKYSIPHFFDTPAILAKMLATDTANAGMQKHESCHPIAEHIRARLEVLDGFVNTPQRVLHGDLRFNNLRFSEGEAIALIDLDTLGRYPLPIEIGNMLRSWCSSRLTKRPSLTFDVWRAAAAAYRKEAVFMTEEEWRMIPKGFKQVTLELAARYLIDAYEESYFAHDAATYPTLFEQNLDRAHFCLAILDEFDMNENAIAALHA